jgi:hypothetical protein
MGVHAPFEGGDSVVKRVRARFQKYGCAKNYTIGKKSSRVGISSAARALLEVKVAKDRAVGRELDRDEEIELFENEIRKMREGEDDPQILVREEELESYLNDGWEFVSVRPSQLMLIRK